MGLITTLEELNEYVEVNSLTDFSVVQPSLRAAERRYLAPVLGPELYAAIQTAYAALPGEEMSDTDQQLLDLCQEAIANIGLSYAVSRISVQISNAGVRRSESETLKTAYQYQEKNAREAFSQAGFDVLEDLLAFLDANKITYQNWVNSTAFTDYRSYFISTGMDFSNYHAIKQSRLVYITIAPIMRNIENFSLVDIIGKPLFNALKAQQAAGAIDSEYQTLLKEYICPGIAMLTVAKGLQHRTLDLTDNGVSVSLQGRNLSIETKEQATGDKFSLAITQLNFDGNDCFKRLGEELAANPTNYPDYVAPVERASLMNINNTYCKSYFGV